MTGRPLVRRLAASIGAVVLLAVLVLVADDNRRVVDLTEDRTLTLSTQTEDVLASVDRDIDITLFARADDPGRVEVVSLLDRYRRLSRRIDVEVRDPDRAPGEVARAGVDPALGGVALRTGDRSEVVALPTEGAITGAIARLLRDDPTLVCASTGHGERALDDRGGGGLSRLRDLLERDGHQLAEVDLLAGAPLADCDALLVAAPTGSMSGEVEESVSRWVAADGRLLVLADPVSAVPVLEALLADLGLTVEPGIVLEGDGDNVVGGDVAAPIVSRYPSAHPVTRGLAPTFFPLVQGISTGDGDGGTTVTPLATTSETSYLESDPAAPAFDPTDDRSGPITVAAAVDRSRVDGPDVARTRLVVVGDVDFATNDAIAEAGNAQLLRQAVAWLVESEDLVAISPNLPADRPLRLTDARLAYARAVAIGGVPALFLLAGAMVWAVRRAR